MSIILAISLRHYFFLFPRIQVNGPTLAVVWLGVMLAICQRAAAGIVTPEQAAAIEAFNERNNRG